jgi:membrane protein DedA with SNARE-associated domain
MGHLLSLLPGFVARDPLPYAFLFLLCFGFVTPLCEELAVALVGATIKATGAPLVPALAAALAAVMLQDSAYFLFARVFGAKVLKQRLIAKLIKPEAVAGGERYFLRRGPIVVFASRFVVGLRSAVILGAGFLKMPWPRFALYDLSAAAIMVPAWLFVGFGLGSQFDAESASLAKAFGIIGPAAVVAGAFLVLRGVRADKARADAEGLPLSPPSAPLRGAGGEPAHDADLIPGAVEDHPAVPVLEGRDEAVAAVVLVAARPAIGGQAEEGVEVLLE